MFNDATLIDVNSTPFEDIEALPDFLEDKIKSSEEYAVRVRHQATWLVWAVRKRRHKTRKIPVTSIRAIINFN